MGLNRSGDTITKFSAGASKKNTTKPSVLLQSNIHHNHGVVVVVSISSPRNFHTLESMNYLRKISVTLSGSKPKEETWRTKLAEASSRDALEEPENHPMRMYVMSVDALCGTEIDQKLPDGWGEKPPLVEEGKNEERRLKAMCRDGIPQALRSAIWITSIVKISRPYQSKEENEEFGTLAKVKILHHGWDYVLTTLFPDESDKEAATIPNFGLDPKEVEAYLIQDHMLQDGKLCAKGVQGVKALTLVLYVAKENLGIEYCPLLPDLTALFLSVMPESYVYACIREMTNSDSYFFPMSKTEHLAWCKSFGDLMRKMYPQTAMAMSRCGALTPEGLDPIFRRFFVGILKKDHIMRILDVYTIEGYKVIFRLGTVILCLAHAYMKPSELKSTKSFWAGVTRVTHSEQFLFDILIKQAYGFNGKKYRSRRSFPRRRFIQKLIRYNEAWAENNAVDDGDLLITNKPLGFVEKDIPIILAKNASERFSLAEFLPFSYKDTKLELIYSSNVHGRSNDMFYKHCSRAKHTITLIEVLDTGATIGMFATETWHRSSKTYGDGECVLFRLKPDPECWHWTHDIEKTMHILGTGDEEDLEEMQSEVAKEHFMYSGTDFISMGAGEDGSAGIRLENDLSRGFSSTARGFNNDPLVSPEYQQFDVGLVEVYHLLRELDGRAIDGEEDIWKAFKMKTSLFFLSLVLGSSFGFTLNNSVTRPRTALKMGFFDSISKAFSNEEFSAPPEGIKATARHILVKDMDQLKQVTAELEAGTPFAQVAKAYSACPSGSSGGDLGSFPPGRMVAEFDEVIFDPESPLNSVLGPVPTQFGYHLIVIDKRTGV